MYLRIRFVCLLFALPLLSSGQSRQPDASKIKLELKRLNSLGAVLYLAAHPDDENTRAIAYLVNDQLMTTGYLSLTRGDGGQNLIGPEIRDLLGLIRTQELLSARRLDGGQQFFTRAIDFGFSKSAKETFEIWNHDEVLSDVVAIIRKFQPDVILTRFPPDERAGHGQHTASAMLAQEAFDKAGDKSVYPDQLKDRSVWQVRRLYFNTGPWWIHSVSDTTAGVVKMNVGAYNTLLGKSYSELAAESRSQHKSQGFGSSGLRGDALDYFGLVRGDNAGKNAFDGINTSWTRLKGGDKIQPLVEKAIEEFNEENPSLTVPALLQIRKAVSQLDGSVWQVRKLEDINKLIQDCLGLFVDVTADSEWGAPGEPLVANFEILNRSDANVQLIEVKAPDLLFDSLLKVPLKNNIPSSFTRKSFLKTDKPYSSPYWLSEPHNQGLFTVRDRSMIGQPENNPAVSVEFSFLVEGERITVSRPLAYRLTDPVRGEVVKPFAVVPPVMVNLSDKVFLFPDLRAKPIAVVVRSASVGEIKGSVTLTVPPGWKTEPSAIPIKLVTKGEETIVSFNVFPGKDIMTASVKAIVDLNGTKFNHAVQVIEYDHIPTQTLLPVAEAKLVRLDLKSEGAVVGYIKGAGDDVPAGLRNMGYQVWEMKDEEVTPDNLKKLDAVVLGVRTLNTNQRIRHYMPDLLEYVKNGGTMIAQYNNNNELEVDANQIAPYSISLSRDRVTEENSKVTLLQPANTALSYPNKINDADFDGWVQERGLYFPNKWDTHFQALLSMHDANEPARDGGLLVAEYGNGHYVYTGLSFFRQLPEGVPGAYRLFANLVSLGQHKKPEGATVKAKGK